MRCSLNKLSDILAPMPTPEATRMAEVVKSSATLLREAGFNKRRHCFNRVTAAGLVHVVNFWQHPKEPPAWTEVPGLRERRYGTFRLDFGVYVPEMTRSSPPRSGWVNEYNCDLRQTIGQLTRGDDQGDWWWPLSDSGAEGSQRRPSLSTDSRGSTDSQTTRRC